MTSRFQTLRRLVLCTLLASPLVWAQSPSIVVSSTTSTEQSGLFGHLLPAFKRATGIDVKVVALGTGQALDVARRGDADVEFVHDKAAEEKFFAEGFGLQRQEVIRAPKHQSERGRIRKPLSALSLCLATNG